MRSHKGHSVRMIKLMLFMLLKSKWWANPCHPLTLVFDFQMPRETFTDPWICKLWVVKVLKCLPFESLIKSQTHAANWKTGWGWEGEENPNKELEKDSSIIRNLQKGRPLVILKTTMAFKLCILLAWKAWWHMSNTKSCGTVFCGWYHSLTMPGFLAQESKTIKWLQ